MYILKSKEVILEIPIDNILYITSSKKPHQVKIVTTDEEYFVYRTLKSFEESYSIFVKCHKSTIVNIKQISKINRENKKVIFKNNNYSISYSRREYRQLVTSWKNSILPK
ncbi:LytR/AlgR family response regulator transcription factor [Listeria cossartiae]|uniref:LytR/AlgR family response regulator transcription factor n=1 Tax=Listeria cossartiae TaxID=2838249 RepID=UPI001624E973|nr:LytTR family transcriptional regulator [Listeria cossartiae subsp. cossartiae]MCD2246586.1 LytTR family transcriptional regulator [Listeria marthii]MBC1548200.1 LytTR family transcriptional regulator [Listeria cossartiae subsp. cossartiae]MBC1550145.1 LytTR family transcriptional regulator [Listeria cossartiae subsp. cossartiae]MBC1567885.1 LytTR family transcriptional regulator [Listeria cossartiae subsp. cossartiae]